MKARTLLGAASTALFAAMLPLSAHAVDTVTINYFTIASTDQDANHLGGGTVDNEVQTHLGPNGLPVLNTSAYGCTSNCFTLGPPTDVLSTGEITYWSPALNNGGAGGTSDVMATGSANVTLPFSVPTDFFPPNGIGSGDGGNNGYLAAVLSGTLNAPGTELISFSIGADDMAFAYLDGVNVCDLGGVHPATTGTCVTPFDIAAGPHDLRVFFVDINQVQSGFTFGLNTQGVTIQPAVPEPSTYALFGLGLLGLGAMVRRRKSRRGEGSAQRLALA
ncbi:MAG TPA: PEP-CTERM sorting domain-containing protein [Caldimonas sp.]|nr:PEP-CTERM sorting domain-containing protein [Caldimonas sp.]